MSSRQPISELPNLGPKSQAALAAAGITTVAQLRRLGSAASREGREAMTEAILRLFVTLIFTALIMVLPVAIWWNVISQWPGP